MMRFTERTGAPTISRRFRRTCNDRDNLLPDRRNLFAYPLGPGSTENTFQHAAGEAIFNLPNGLQGYILVNANNVRQDKGVTAIVSDPKRPDRAVEAGVSCMNCHARGIIPKADQIRAHVAKNPKAFSRTDAELIRALYVPEKKMKALMDEDAERFRKALEKTGNKIGSAEVVMTMTLQYEADVDLPTLAAEAGVKPEDLLARLTKSEVLTKNLGALKVPGGQVARQVVVQAFGDVVRELRLGSPIQPGSLIQNLPDNTGEIDPLEAQSSPANALAFSSDGRYAAIASADKTVRIWDVDAEPRGAPLHRPHGVGLGRRVFAGRHDDFSPAARTTACRLWDVETGRELKKLDGHIDMVTAVAFSPDGRRALSTGYDHEAILWDLEKFEPIETFKLERRRAALHERRRLLARRRSRPDLCREDDVPVRREDGPTTCAASPATPPPSSAPSFPATASICCPAATITRCVCGTWQRRSKCRCSTDTRTASRASRFRRTASKLLSGSTDATVRLWDIDTAKELKVFRKHTEPLVAVAFVDQGRQTLSGSRDAIILPWVLVKAPTDTNPNPDPDAGRSESGSPRSFAR